MEWAWLGLWIGGGWGVCGCFDTKWSGLGTGGMIHCGCDCWRWVAWGLRHDDDKVLRTVYGIGIVKLC